MEYRAESELGSLARDLLADLERIRPGLPEEAQAEDVQRATAARVRLRLSELYREQHEGEGDLAAPEHEAQLRLYEREVDQILVPRYAALALRQNRAERAPSLALRGGDAFNRVAYGLLLFIVGLLVVWAPFIPIWEKWIPFALGGLAVAFAPALPDLHRALLRRRHEVLLLALLIDLDRAGRALPASPELPALPERSTPRAGEPGAPR